MEFTEKDATTFARIGKGKKAQVCETCGSLEKRSRHLIEQRALFKHDIDTFKNKLATIGIQDYLTGFAHVCECSPLCPAIWSMLPMNLLQRVFARLPLRDIIRLRIVSKTWDRYVTGVTLGFTKLCAEQNPNMFALVSKGAYYFNDNGPMIIKLYDRKENRWHRFVHETIVPLNCQTIFAGNGGLVCLVSSSRDKEMFPLNITVFNLLTRQLRELPSLSSLRQILPRMVQLVMDRESKCYKVLVVGLKDQGGGNEVARIFSSETGQWSKPNIFSDLIFGCHYPWENGSGFEMETGQKVGACAYNCASKALLELDDGSYPSSCGVGNKGVLIKDHLFVLHIDDDDEYSLTEYQAQSCQPHWVQLKVHKCSALNEVCRYEWDTEFETQLFGCQDFLLVNAFQRHDYNYHYIKNTLLFDLSTNQWQIIPKLPERSPFGRAENKYKYGRWSPYESVGHIFELQWDVVP